jgi:4-hydroxy-3-polyprenylbenzoate decarboxylase
MPTISPQPPWHGYTLGDWADDWETFAQRAVKGDWEMSGKETFARRRGGLTPETPVRDADSKDKL